MPICPICHTRVPPSESTCPACGSTLPEPGAPDAWAEVDRLLLADRKIEAIKVYRKATGLGLEEATEAVEARERRAHGRPVTRPPSSAPEPDLWADIDPLLARGEKIAAIKLLRERAGLGLEESKEAIEARRSSSPSAADDRVGRSGCLVAVAPLLAGALWVLCQ